TRLWLSDSVRLAIMGAAEAKACALRSTAARHHGLSMPRRFRVDGRVVEVVKVLDQWFGADYRYCKVKGADCALYILRLDENRSDFSRCMQARKLKLSRHNPGATCGLIAAAQPGNGDLTAPPTKTSEVRHWAVKHREFHEACWRHCHGVIAGGTDQKRPGSGCSEPNALSRIAARS